jgi:hypothetical protein
MNLQSFLRHIRYGAVATVVAVASGCATHSGHETAPRPEDGRALRKAHYYQDRQYGSEAQYNPLAAILNNGYDQIRTYPDRGAFEFDYGTAAVGSWNSIVRANKLVSKYGTWNWVRYELLPLSGKGEGGSQWWPNYQLHLFAGGVTYVRLMAWFEQRGYKHPRLNAAITSYAGHVLNEMIENPGYRNGTVDGMTDLLIFDPAAILLWNSTRVQRFFGTRVELTEWPGQPTLANPGHTIENTYQTTMVRARLPKTNNWRVFTTMGGSYLGGVSRRTGDSTWISFGAGSDAQSNAIVDTLTGRKTVALLANAGLFIDRGGSLLGSVVLKSGYESGATVNLYPGVMRFGTSRIAPGMWFQYLPKRHEVRFGITSALGVGIGRNPPAP